VYKYRLINVKLVGFGCVQELIEELGIYFLHFDRAGYGESDPYSSRSVKSEAYDIQELADKLEIGDKFYIIGMSMGGYSVWSCLKYIPHRHVNYLLVSSFWFSCFPFLHRINDFYTIKM